MQLPVHCSCSFAMELYFTNHEHFLELPYRLGTRPPWRVTRLVLTCYQPVVCWQTALTFEGKADRVVRVPVAPLPHTARRHGSSGASETSRCCFRIAVVTYCFG